MGIVVHACNLKKNRSEIALISHIPKYSRDLNAEAIFLVENDLYGK